MWRWFLVPMLAMAHPTGKIIGGRAAGSSELGFVVALMKCRGSSCDRFCTGSLIAPNVVMTAAHCVRNNFSPFNDDSPNTPLSSIKVLVGSKSLTVRESGSRLVDVSMIRFGSYGTNIRFGWDGDIALLNLSECLSVVPGKIEFAVVATYNTDPMGGRCQSVNIAGFGYQANAPDQLRDSDELLHYIVDKLHSGEQCRDVYIGLAQNQLPPDLSRADAALLYEILPDTHICTGGLSSHAACFGDSGGPTFVYLPDGKAQIIGITSFGGGTVFCTLGPDFSTRVAFHAAWIRDAILTDFTTCSGWEVKDAFASWPVRKWDKSMLSVPYLESRCGTDGLWWQCQDGQCIEKTKVCDGTATCRDGTDESYMSAGVSLCWGGGVSKKEGPSLPSESRIDYGRREKLSPDRKSVACTIGVASVEAAISTAKVANTAGVDPWDTSALEIACDVFESCSVDSESGTARYVNAETFCNDLLTYIYERSSAETAGNLMRSKMGFGCADDSTINESNSVYVGTSYATSLPAADGADIGTGPANSGVREGWFCMIVLTIVLTYP